LASASIREFARERDELRERLGIPATVVLGEQLAQWFLDIAHGCSVMVPRQGVLPASTWLSQVESLAG